MRAPRRPASSGGASRFILTLTACLIALAITAVFAVRYLVIDAPARAAVDTARGISAVVAEAFQVQPRIVVRGKTIIHQDAEALKLVTLERPITERYQWSHSWLGSTKTFEIEGDFVARAGFDLEKPFVIEIDPATGNLVARLPDPKILSVDLQNLRILTDDDGHWNKLTPADREQAIAELNARATKSAAATDLTQRARESAEKRLRDLLTTGSREVRFDSVPKD